MKKISINKSKDIIAGLNKKCGTCGKSMWVPNNQSKIRHQSSSSHTIAKGKLVQNTINCLI